MGGIVLLGHFCGWDSFAPQAGDWSKHNAVLFDLTGRSWPVYYQEHDPAMLTYYIGQYLIPAMVGKLLGGNANITYCALFAWNSIGMLILLGWVFLHTDASSFKKQLGVFVGMVFYNGLVLLANYTASAFGYSNDVANAHLFSKWGFMLQYRSMFVSMRWVAPQFIVPSICTALFMQYRDRVEYYVFLLLPCIFYGVFQMIALVTLVCLYAVVQLWKEPGANKGLYIKRVFSPWNILQAVLLGGILILYYWGNVMGEKPASVGWKFYNFFANVRDFGFYVIFCVFYFGIYLALIFPVYRRDSVLWCSALMLLLIPFVCMGKYNDFCMCTSMIPLFVLFIKIWRFLLQQTENQRWVKRKCILATLLCVAALSPFAELAKIVREDVPGQQAGFYASLARYTERASTEHPEDWIYNYFTYEPQDDLFVKYIAKNGME